MNVRSLLSKPNEVFIALDKAGFTVEVLEQIINSKGNAVARAMHAAAMDALGRGDTTLRWGWPTLFRLNQEIEISVPSHYRHATWIDEFCARKNGELEVALESTRDFTGHVRIRDGAITSKNFSTDCSVLVPGQRYIAQFYQASQRITTETWLTFTKSIGVINPGVHGLFLVLDLAEKEIEYGYHQNIRALEDEQPNSEFYQSREGQVVPSALKRSERSGGQWDVDLTYYGHHDRELLLCFKSV